MRNKGGLLLGLLFSVLFSSMPNTAKSEGSLELNTNDNSYRAHTWYNLTYKKSGMEAKTVIYVIARKDETICLGSSSLNKHDDYPADISIKHRETGATTLLDVTNAKGYFNTREQEKAGPRFGSNASTANAWEPLTFKVPYDGIYEVIFYPRVYNATSGAAYNVRANATINHDNQSTFTSMWDISVFDVDDQMRKGRVFMNSLALDLCYNDYNNNDYFWYANLYILTKDGYIYNFQPNGMDPRIFMFYSNNVGLIDGTSNQTLYKHAILPQGSTNIDNTSVMKGNVRFPIPNYQNSQSVVTHRIFLNYPDSDIKNIVADFNIEPEIFAKTTTDLSFIGNRDPNNNSGLTNMSNGGIFTMSFDRRCTYELIIDTDRDNQFTANDKIIMDAAAEGENYIIWDGTDKEGTPVAIGNYNVQIRVHGGEMHLPLFDVEANKNGSIIKLENALASGSSSLDSDEQYNIFYDGKEYTTYNGTFVDIPQENGNPGTHLTGNPICSKNGAFKFIYTNGERFGDNKILDIWTYVVKDDPEYQKTSTINIENSDGNTYGILQGKVYYDSNQSGTYDATELGLAGIEVTILNADNTPLLTNNGTPYRAITNKAGLYTITGIPYSGSTDYKVHYNPVANNGTAYTITSNQNQIVSINRVLNFAEFAGAYVGYDVILTNLTAPTEVNIGQPLVVSATVKNNQVTTAENVKVTFPTTISVSKDTEYEATTGSYADDVWNIGTLAPNTTATITLTLYPNVSGTYNFVANATCTNDNEISTKSTTIKINKVNTYTITFDGNGAESGTVASMTGSTTATSIVLPANNFVRAGYTFGGWTESASSNRAYFQPGDAYTFSPEWPEVNTLYAFWIANPMDYKVNHMLENANNDSYTLDNTETITSKSGLLTTAAAQTFEQFTAQPFTQEIIKGDGTTVINIYYKRNTYTLTWDTNGGTINSASTYSHGTVKFGATITAPTPTKTGHSYTWDATPATTMPATDLTYTAVWTPNTYDYIVKHMGQEVDGTEFTELLEEETLQGTFGTTTAATAKSIIGFTVKTPIAQKTIGVSGTEVIIEYTRNSYTLAWNANGGQLSGTYTSGTVKYGANITAPTATRQGYTFGAWTPIVPTTMPAGDLTLEASWTANTNTKYTVKHYQENLDGTYPTAPTATENLTGTTGAQTAAAAKSYTGFTAQTFSQAAINANGSTVIEIRYKRNSYTLTWNANGGTINTTPAYTSGSVKYGANITAPTVTRQGYTFSAWTPTVPTTMPANNLTLEASWTANTNTKYTVKHYQENLNGTYPTAPTATENLTGTTGAQTAAAAKSYTGFTAQTFSQAAINANGSTVIEIRYKRNSYTLTWNANGGTINTTPAYTSGSVKYGATITAPTLTKTGHSYSWNVTPATTMPANNISYSAVWTPNTYNYTVKHMGQKLNGTTFTDVLASETLQGTFGTTTAATAKSIVGFTAKTPITQTTIGVSGTEVIIEYTRNSYALAWDANGGQLSGTYTQNGQIPFGSPLTAPTATRQGYTFDKWTPTIPTTMPANNLTPKASWIAADVNYVVNHFQETLTDNNESYSYLANSETLTGKTGAQTIAKAKNYTGFVAQTITQKTINADGSTIVNINYKRTRNTVTWIVDGSTFAENEYKYEAAITAPTAPTKVGYTFQNWTPTVVQKMGTQNLTYTAVYSANTDTKYTVDIYTQNIDDNNYQKTNKTLSGTTGQLTNYTAEDKEGFTLVDFAQATIKGDGTTILSIYYNRNSYTLTWDANGGTINTTPAYTSGSVKYGAPITAPQVTRTGYSFSGWQPNINTMPAANTTCVAQWTESGDTPYSIEHYQQNLALNGYELVDTESKTGKTNAQTSVAGKNYDGFTINNIENVTITADGQSIAKIYYTRNIYTISWEIDGVTITDDCTNGNVAFGTPIIAPASPTKEGYTFKDWGEPLATTMPSHNLNYNAAWTANNNTPYTVNHYLANLDGSYSDTPTDTDMLTGITAEQTNANAQTYIGFTAQPFEQQVILANGTTVINIRYTRNLHTLTWVVDNDDITTPNYTAGGLIPYGTPIVAPELSKAGYTYSWDNLPTTMPNNDITCTAQWTANNNIPYIVNHYQQALDGSFILITETENLVGTTNTMTQATAKEYIGFTAQSFEQQNISPITTTTIDIRYTRNQYQLSWIIGNGTIDNTQPYTADGHVLFGTPIVAPVLHYNELAYKWDTLPLTMPANNITCTAIWSLSDKQARYIVRHSLQTLDGKYNIYKVDTLFGTIGEKSEAKAISIEGFDAQDFKQQNISDMLAVEIRYNRKLYNLSWELNGGNIITQEYTHAGKIAFGTPLVAPELVKDGFLHTWNNLPTTMPANNLTCSAQWSICDYSTLPIKFNVPTLFRTCENEGSIEVTDIAPKNVSIRWSINGVVDPSQTSTTFTLPDTAELNGNIYVTLYDNNARVTKTIKYQTDKRITTTLWDDVITVVNTDEIFETFKWYHNDTEVSDKPYYNEIGGLTGSYYLIATTTSGDTVRSCLDTFTNSQQQSIIAYPNPTASKIFVKSGKWQQGDILRISDSNGKTWLNRKIAATEVEEFDLSTLPQGAYIITVGNESISIIKH